MTKTVFRMKLSWLHLDVRKFAQDIGVPLKHVVAWRNGTRKVPVVVAKLIDAWLMLERIEASANKKTKTAEKKVEER
jgi:hypothetical protein